MKIGFWLVYSLLLLFRLVVCLSSTGYIHPDEFFQNPEASSALVFRDSDICCLKTWEFNSPQIRSLSIPLLTTGLPFMLLKLTLGDTSGTLPSTLSMFWTSRMSFFIQSLALDLCVIIIGKRFSHNMHWRRCLLFLASAWPVLTFGVRSFSNTVELNLLTILLCVVANPAAMTYARAIVVPVLGALGLFNRFTFVAFAAPLALYHAFRCIFTYNSKAKTYELLPTKRCFGLVSVSVAAFCGSVAALVCFDTYLFTGSISVQSLVIAPLNFLKYNSDPANLALHGTHPRWLHALVNLPLLVFPLLPASIVHSISSFASEVSSKWRKGPNKVLPILCGGIVASSLAILSVAPHQELRFLLPLVFPVLLLTFWENNDDDKDTNKEGKKVMKKRRDSGCFSCVFIMWFAYNMLFTSFFGYAQQGGVEPSLMNIGERIRMNSRMYGKPIMNNIVYWHTYMPPRHLLSASKKIINLTDLASAPESKLLETVDDVIKSAEMRRVCEDLWIVVPSVEKSANEKLRQRSLHMMESFAPHIGLDNDEIEVYKSVTFGKMSSKMTFRECAGLNLYKKKVGVCGNED